VRLLYTTVTTITTKATFSYLDTPRLATTVPFWPRRFASWFCMFSFTSLILSRYDTDLTWCRSIGTSTLHHVPYRIYRIQTKHVTSRSIHESVVIPFSTYRYPGGNAGTHLVTHRHYSTIRSTTPSSFPATDHRPPTTKVYKYIQTVACVAQ
jgi:hypothetical protein